MALRAFREEFDELAANMPKAPNLHAANDTGGVAPQDIVKTLSNLDESIASWRALTVGTLHHLRSTLVLAEKEGNYGALRYACDEALPLVASKVAEVLSLLDRSKDLSIGQEAILERISARSLADKGFLKFVKKRRHAVMYGNIEKAQRLFDNVHAMILDFDPEAREIVGKASSNRDIDDFFNGLAAE